MSLLLEARKFLSIYLNTCILMGFSGSSVVKRSACQCRRLRKHGFDPWVRKIPWSREWQLTAVFLPGEFHGQRNLACYTPWGHKEKDMTECA